MRPLIFTILKAGFIVGTLDILSAFLYFLITTGNEKVFTVLRYVASGAFGKQAFSGGNEMLFAGLILHYCIAFSFTILFFYLYPRIPFLAKNRLLSGILYGLFIWTVMNLIVVPLSNIGIRPFDSINAIINAVILIICIGIPLSYMASRFFRKQNFKMVQAQKDKDYEALVES